MISDISPTQSAEGRINTFSRFNIRLLLACRANLMLRNHILPLLDDSLTLREISFPWADLKGKLGTDHVFVVEKKKKAYSN